MGFKKVGYGAALATLLAMTTSVAAQEQVVNVYNWSDYIDPAAIEEFQKTTGIKVNYDVYDSNEVLEAKLMSGRSGYDVVVPTGSFLERHVQAGIYAEVDQSSLSNIGNLDAVLLKQIENHDAGNKHSVPWAWGTIGLGYNVDMLKQRLGDVPFDTLDLVFNPEVAAKVADCGIALLDSPAEVVSIALHYLGLDPNSEDKGDLKKAADLMKSVRSSIKYFHSSKSISDLANGEICVAMGYNGDMLQSKDRAAEAGQGVNVEFSIPSEGTMVWFDLMAIPADAPHKDNAHKFIDFILQPEIAAGISNYVFYAVPNTPAEKLLDAEVKNNQGIYPSDEVKAKLFTQQAHSAKFDRRLNRTWTAIKTNR